MKTIYSPLFILCLFLLGGNIAANAQIVTNAGDTISIKQGDFIYVNGGLNLKDSLGRHPMLNNEGKIIITSHFTKTAGAIYKGAQDTVWLTSQDSQAFPGFSYYRLIGDSGGTKYLFGNAFIRKELMMPKALYITGNDTIRLDSLAQTDDNDSNYVVGNTVISQYFGQGFDYTNGNIGLETVAANSSPGFSTVFRKTGIDAIQLGFCSNGIAKYYQVYPTNNTNLGASIIFSYFPHELNGIPQKELAMFRSLDNGKTWFKMIGALNDTFTRTVNMLSTDTFGRYTLASTINPLVNPLKAGPAASVCGGEPVTLGGDSITGHVYSWTSDPSGFQSSLSNPIVNPKVTTKYYLKEIVPNSLCINTDSVLITVRPEPKAGFAFTESCAGYHFMASDTSNKGFIWDFGDGDSAIGNVADHTFKGDSITKVKLTVTDKNGCSSTHDTTYFFHGNNINFKIFPNPASEMAYLSFVLCQASDVAITIWDVRGRQLATLHDGNLSEGYYKFDIDFKANHWRQAMYMVKTQINDKVYTNKVIRQE